MDFFKITRSEVLAGIGLKVFEVDTVEYMYNEMVCL